MRVLDACNYVCNRQLTLCCSALRTSIGICKAFLCAEALPIGCTLSICKASCSGIGIGTTSLLKHWHWLQPHASVELWAVLLEAVDHVHVHGQEQVAFRCWWPKVEEVEIGVPELNLL